MAPSLFTKIANLFDCGYHDEPKTGEYLFQRPGLQLLRNAPRDGEYRIVKISDTLHLQSKCRDEWRFVEAYDEGYDAYGKLRNGGWVKLANVARYTETGLCNIALQIKGKPPAVEVVKTL